MVLLNYIDTDTVVGMEIIDDENKNIFVCNLKWLQQAYTAMGHRVAHRGGLGVRTIPGGSS